MGIASEDASCGGILGVSWSRWRHDCDPQAGVLPGSCRGLCSTTISTILRVADSLVCRVLTDWSTVSVLAFGLESYAADTDGPLGSFWRILKAAFYDGFQATLIIDEGDVVGSD